MAKICKILIIDDSALMRSVISDIIKRIIVLKCRIQQRMVYLDWIYSFGIMVNMTLYY